MINKEEACDELLNPEKTLERLANPEPQKGETEETDGEPPEEKEQPYSKNCCPGGNTGDRRRTAVGIYDKA